MFLSVTPRLRLSNCEQTGEHLAVDATGRPSFSPRLFQRKKGLLDGSGDAAPAPSFELRDGKAEFEFQGISGVEVAAAVAPQDFELAVATWVVGSERRMTFG